MRLTAQILNNAPSYINTLGDRTLSLRDLQLPMLEHTESIKDIYTTLDLTNNDLRTLGGSIPLLTRLKCVLVAKNRISAINHALSTSVPNLTTLSLVDNNLSDFKSLESLKNCSRLVNLYITGNPVSSKDNYRELIIWLVPSLSVLDFERVTMREKNRAKELFGTHDDPTPLLQQLLSVTERVEIDPETRIRLTDEEKIQLKEQLKKATSLVEIDRIETALKTGYLP